MNITSPIQTGAGHAAEIPADSLTSILRAIGFGDSPDGGLGILMSGLAGIAAALAVAIVLWVYFRSGYRSRRDVFRHGLAASAVLILPAFVVSDMRNAALAYLGLDPAKPAVEFEIRLPWHLADGIIPANGGAVTSDNHDAFAIRYRVL